MIEEIRQMLDDYLNWLRDKTLLRDVGKDWVEITTPYLDRFNDYLQIYVRRDNSGYLMSDDGYIIQDLEHSGCSLESPKRKSLLHTTLNGFGVQANKGILEIRANENDFAMRKHNLIQAMLGIGDMFYMAVPHIASLFFEDVAAWFDISEIRYIPKVKFTGKTGYDHLFDFGIAASRDAPERLIKAFNMPSRQNAESIAFAWIDTKATRPPNSKAYALLNDTDRAIPGDILDALKNWDVTPVIWSSREDHKSELAA